MKKQILTQEELDAFYNGIQHDREQDVSEWLGMEYPKELRIPKRRIELGRLVGSGEFGQVFIGMLDQHIQVAIKLPRSTSSGDTFKSALSEVKILCYVGNGTHPNVILFLGAYTKEIAQGKLSILTEYCHNGSLLGYLKTTRGRSECRGGEGNSSGEVDMYQMYRFAVEIASGMEYISEKRVIHGDLATRNVFLNSEHTCKIGDFGLSRKLYQYTEYVKTSQEPLPWRWMAVESLKNMKFTTKSDVWSYGVTVWEIFSLGEIPYPGLAWTPEYANDLMGGMRLAKAEYASDVIHEKLLECWDVNPEDRPTFCELAQYFTDQRSNAYTCVQDALEETNSNEIEPSSKLDKDAI